MHYLMETVAFLKITKKSVKFSIHNCLRKSKQHSYDDDLLVSIPIDVKQWLLIGHFNISKSG